MPQTLKNINDYLIHLQFFIIVVSIVLISTNDILSQNTAQEGQIFSLDKNQEFYFEPEEFGINERIKDDYMVDIAEGKNGKVYWVNRRQILVNAKGTFSEVFNLSGYKRVKQIYHDNKERLWVVFIHNIGDPIEETLLVLNSNDYSELSLDKINVSNLSDVRKTGIGSLFNDIKGDMYILGDNGNLFILKDGMMVASDSNVMVKNRIELDIKNWPNINATISYKNDNYQILSSQYSNLGDITIYIDNRNEKKNEINNTITTDRIDRSAILRFGTNAKLKFHDFNTLILNTEKKISIFNLKENLELKIEEEIPGIFKDRNIIGVQIIDDNIWVGTNKGLIKITKYRREFTSFLDKQSISVRNIINIGNDSIIIAHENGISLYNPAQRTLKTRITDIAAYGLVQKKTRSSLILIHLNYSYPILKIKKTGKILT